MQIAGVRYIYQDCRELIGVVCVLTSFLAYMGSFSAADAATTAQAIQKAARSGG